MTEKALTHKDPIVSLLSQYKGAIKSVLPKHLTPERVLRIAYMAVQRTPKLRDCTHASLINAIIEVSKQGLEIGRTAHIIPFKREAVFICDYKYGTDPWIKHKPYRKEDRGNLVAAYAVTHYKHGGFDFEVIEKADAEAIKKRSPGAKTKDSPWNTEDEWTMWCKSAVRRLVKRVPQSPELQRAAYLDEMAEGGMKQEFEDAIDAEFAEAPPSTEEIEGEIDKLGEEKGETVEKITKDPRSQTIELIKDTFSEAIITKAKKDLSFATGKGAWPTTQSGAKKLFDKCQELFEKVGG
ncbi:MAG: recombinase RecT [Planctomycetota bacterium]|jgi:recombination protein RecT